MKRRVATLAAAGAIALAAAPAASADTFVVTVRDDPAPGACDAEHCSLREAVLAANARQGPDTVSMPLLGPSVHDVNIPSTGEDAAVDGDLDVAGRLAVEHPGQGRATIDADGDRAFEVMAGAELRIEDLLIQGGDAPEGDGDGGGIHVGPGARATVIGTRLYANEAHDGRGGSIYVGPGAALRFVDSESAGALAAVEGGGIAAAEGSTVEIVRSLFVKSEADVGGALSARGAVAIESSTLNVSGAVGGRASGARYGGAIHLGPTAELSLVNSSLWGNRALLDGGAIYAEPGAAASLNAATILGNRAGVGRGERGRGGGIFAAGGEPGIAIENSILARNRGDGELSDCASRSDGRVDSRGQNLLSTFAGGCGFARPADLVGPNPRLASTRRGFVPRADSPAIDAAGPDAPARDLSGRRRDRKPDIGALEAR